VTVASNRRLNHLPINIRRWIRHSRNDVFLVDGRVCKIKATTGARAGAICLSTRPSSLSMQPSEGSAPAASMTLPACHPRSALRRKKSCSVLPRRIYSSRRSFISHALHADHSRRDHRERGRLNSKFPRTCSKGLDDRTPRASRFSTH